ncbi:uncharacterized protein PITG_01277 [Phytophthora infestans T30-4]|uniref:Uncharacterized protein n=1 Tax=Phytophthora infestans (strain T30-4) TaxID=403677 RepID=D0MV37_PHYIT|nr:uncharacterized protein PITG_01277 [Phytophthora infestans T30-4]EEY61033.1 hypothetical protein PITG_01277 [Phytophthora infestans T30-4]|eukprot:XP_002907950.1 hypothetical protein PITG_01277 [Phytophthora infestans T30-4]
MEKDHAVKLQQTIETHKQIEQRLRSQLQTVQHEQQAAADNARRVRSLLTRVSNWMRQVQHAAQRERSSIHKSKLVAHDLELRVTPRTESPYRLWSSGTRLATNVPDVNPLPPPAPGRNRAKSLPAKGFSYRSTGSLLAYCAHVVTTSLSGGRSPPSPQSKVTPAWKLDRLSNKPLDVALPNLSIGLL